MTKPLTLECEVHFRRKSKGRNTIQPGHEAGPACEPGRVPRIAKLMALAIRFDGLIRDGVVRDYAELARLGRVSRARLTQIMNLLMLPPDIQEEILFLSRVEQEGCADAQDVAKDLAVAGLAEAAEGVENARAWALSGPVWRRRSAGEDADR